MGMTDRRDCFGKAKKKNSAAQKEEAWLQGDFGLLSESERGTRKSKSLFKH
jgi:hypothetical protein